MDGIRGYVKSAFAKAWEDAQTWEPLKGEAAPILMKGQHSAASPIVRGAASEFFASSWGVLGRS